MVELQGWRRHLGLEMAWDAELLAPLSLQRLYKRISKGGLKFATTTEIRLWNISAWLFCAIFLTSRYASVSLGQGSTCLPHICFVCCSVVRLECVEYAILIPGKKDYAVYRTCLVWRGPVDDGYDFVSVRWFIQMIQSKSEAICCLLNFWFYLMQKISHGSTSTLCRKANIICWWACCCLVLTILVP